MGFGAGMRVEYLGISLEIQYNYDFLIPSRGVGTDGEIVFSNEILTFWLGYTYSFAPEKNRYAR